MSAVLASAEIKPLVEKLVEAYPTSLAGIDPERIVYVRSPGKKKPAIIKTIPSPYDLFVDYKFILTVYSNKFDKLDENRQAIAIFDELIRIKDFDAGKLSGYSVVSNYETVTKWGPDWESSEDELTAFDVAE